MKAYWVTGLSNPDSSGHYCGTLTEAHALGKEEQRHRWPEVFIDEVELETDKAAILRMVNDEGKYQTMGNRIWTLTPRGGLRELSPEEMADARAG